MEYLRLLLLLAHLVVVCKSQDCAGTGIFVITLGQSSRSRTLDRFSVTSLQDCIDRCTAYGNKCRAVNYLLVAQSTNLECLILDTYGLSVTDAAVSLNDTVGSIYAERLCMKQRYQLCRGSWTFDLTPNVELVDEKGQQFILKQDQLVTNEQCLGRCLETVGCRMTQIDHGRNLCTLLSLTRHAVRHYDYKDYFRPSTKVHLYENNCNSNTRSNSTYLNQSDCKYITKKVGKVGKVYVQVVRNFDNAVSCQLACTDSDQFPCRSYFWDISKNLCYLSHTSVLDFRKGSDEDNLNSDTSSTFDAMIVYGELDDCIGRLECGQNSMTVRGQTVKMFTGSFGVKVGNVDKACNTNIADSSNFSFTVNFNDCGTKNENGTIYTNIVQLKDGFSSLITYRDRQAKVVCRIGNQRLDDITVTVSLQVIANTTGEIVLLRNDKPTLISPKFSLKVLNSKQVPVNSVHLGEYGYLEVTFDNVTDETNNVKMQVSNLIAEDVKNGKQLQLFDYEGCPINPDLVENFESMGKNTLRSKLQFFGFPETAKVYYKGDVRPCLGECPFKSCKRASQTNKKFFGISKRRRRYASKLFDDGGYSIESDLVQHEKPISRLLDEKWTEDWNIKPIRLPKLLDLLNDVYGADYESEMQTSTLPTQETFEPTATVHDCQIVKSLSCIATVFLIAFHCMLMMLCVFIVGFYCKFFRKRQKADSVESTSISVVSGKFDTKIPM